MNTKAAKIRSISLIVVAALLTTPMLGFRACKKASPSQQVQIARAAAAVPLVAKTVREIGAVLVAERALTSDGLTKLTVILNKTVDVTDHLQGDLQAGHFDPQAWDTALTNLTNDWIAISAIVATNIDPRVNEWLALVQYLVPLIKSLVDQIKPPTPPVTPTITAEGQAKARVSPGGVAAIVAISVGASIKYLGIQNDSSVDSLWAKYRTYSAEYHGDASNTR